jgi:hypothetical protein
LSFDEPQLGVFTSVLIREGADVLLVMHDEQGDWQFLAGSESAADQAVFVHVGHVIASDQSLGDLADLPLGWRARRTTIESPWTREPIPADLERL